ncbi:MlaD family protein [Rhizobium alvei]|uniref:MlaD family protein n=1 Tax=Rhizobium alvei TaxID=1132659 RepID=A0ABT8YKR1_9HYPH|nr:MlaD family protein [Rhizobium alvei]MDO6963938.1 MlaD family protein [Rhizobium alvei]
METKANYAIVGFFTLMVVLAAFVFVYWMSVYGREGKMEQLILRIPGSANGLSVGSPVRFNGIPIGSVRQLDFDREDPAFSLALTEIRSDSPVYPTTRAVLEIQGLTGASYIEMSGGNPKDEPVLVTAHREGKVAVILAEQSGVTNLLATASEIMKKTDATLDVIKGFTEQNREPLSATIRNVETFSKALKDNSDGIDRFLGSVSGLSDTFNKLSGRLDSTLASVDSLVKAVDAKKIDSILANADKISGDLADASGEVSKTIESFRKTADTYRDIGEKASKTLDNVDRLIAAVDPAKLGQSMDDIQASAADARSAIAAFKGVSEDISKRRPDIDRLIANFTDMSDKLNKASTRVDGVLAKVDSFLGSGDSSSLFADARETMKSFKAVADNLNAKIGPIADNLARFSGSGLKDIEALVQDTRRTMRTLDSAVTRLDQDPRRLIFGGEEVKRYDGRTRR